MKALYLFVFLVSGLLLSGQNSFDFVYGTGEDELLLNAIEDYNQNVILVGRIGDRDSFFYNPLIIKVYPNGSYVSKRFASIDTNSYFQTINLLSDSTYLITSTSSIMSGFDFDNLIVYNIDTNLNLISKKNYRMLGDTSKYSGFGFQYSFIDYSNNIVVAGSKQYDDFSDILLMKLNQFGDTLITKTHPFQFGQQIINISCVPGTNEYLGIAGLIVFNYGPVRFDSVLNIINIEHFPSEIKNKGTSDHWINDTTYMYSCLSIKDHERRIMVYNIDTAMQFLKSLELDKPDTSDYPAWLTSMAYANDSTIYVGGFTHTLDFYPTNPSAVEIYLIDTELNLLGYKEYGWDANYDVYGMKATSDNGCVLFGNRRTEDNTTESDVYVLKVLREDFDITTAIVDTDNSKLPYSKAWPNPVKEKLFIKLFNHESAFVDVEIYNFSGKKMTQQRVFGNGNTMEINVLPLSTGTYIYRISSSNMQIITGKFIKTN